MTAMEDIPQSWKPMESELEKAARKGKVKFLTRAIASSKPPEYWLSRFIPTQGKELYAGNILHLAVWHGKEAFVKKVIRELPEVVVSRLLRHREPAGEVRNRTPALLAIERGESSIAETLTSGSWAELIQDIVDDQGNSPLFLAVKNGLDNVVTNLLNCKGALCGRGPNGLTALHVVPGLLHDKSGSRWFSWLLGGGNNNGYEVSKMLLERLRELITTTDDNGFTILHKWVEMHSQSDISTKDRIEQLLTYFFKHCQDDAVKLMSMTDHIRGNNPLHHTVTCAPTSTDGVAKKLVELCKKCTTSEGSNLLQNHDKPWLMKNKDGDTPLFLAIHNNRDQLAVHFLSADPVGSLRLSDQRNPFVLALCKRCYRPAKEILAVIAEHHDLMSLLPFDDSPGPDILHLALRFPDTFIEEVKEKLPSLKHGKKLGSYAEYRVFTWASWKSMDAELTKAACSGDVDFLRDKIASEPRTYWLSRYVPSDDGVPYGGNIFHLAIWQMKTEFVKQAMGKLPKEVVDLLLWQQETAGELINSNPLHLAVSKKDHLLVKAIVERDNHTLLNSSNSSRPLDVCPEIACKYRAKDLKGRAPALLAIEQGDSCCADILTSKHRAELIQDIVDNEGNSPLFLAVKKGLPKVVLHLLDCVGSLCSSGPDGSTALHVAAGLSNSSDNVDVIYEKLFRRFPKLITERDNNGFTVLHKWVEMGCKPVDDHAADKSNLESLLEYFFNSHGADAAKLMLATDSTAGNNPLHTLVATSTSTSTSTVSEPVAVKIATQLTGLFKKCAASNLSQNHDRPWFMKNKNGDTPLLLAMHYNLEDLAFCFLKYDRKKTLLASAEKENPLEFAVNNGCQRVVAEILDITVAEKDLTSLLTFSDGSNVLHSASASDFPEKVIKKVVEKFPHLITLADGEGETPLDKASEAGKLRLVELMVKKDPGSLSKACHAWQRACEEGHLDVIKLFIKHCPAFRGVCLGCRDTPLHHLNREKCGYAQYRELLDHKVIAEMINTRDSQNKTPLHRAIMKEDIDLTEVLLTMDDINFYIKDKEENTAMDLLAQISEHKGEWREMCERVEIDPRLKTTYVQRHKDLLKIREALLVVAALLASITFQAGFTLPGGLKNDSGEAVLAKKGAFLAFLLADAYGMCCSILVLFCLLWSMFCVGDKSMLLIDWSMSILLHSLYASLVAFMTGVYIVISHGSMWAAITTIVMCSVIGISAVNGKILQRLLSIANRGYYKLLKGLGKAFTSMKKSSGTDSMGEAITTTNQSSDRNSEEQAPISTIKSPDSNSKGEASTSRSKRSETNSKGEASVSTIESSDRNSTSDHIVQIQIK